MTCTVLYSLFSFAYITKENKTFVRIYSKVITGTCDVSYMYRYADPIAGRHEAHLRKATRSGVKSARAKEQVNEIAEATQQSTKSGRLHLSYNDNNEIIDLLLCQDETFTVFLIIIHELFVYVYLIANSRYLSYSNLPVHVSL